MDWPLILLAAVVTLGVVLGAALAAVTIHGWRSSVPDPHDVVGESVCQPNLDYDLHVRREDG